MSYMSYVTLIQCGDDRFSSEGMKTQGTQERKVESYRGLLCPLDGIGNHVQTYKVVRIIVKQCSVTCTV